jgi:hypothetical protein
MQNSFGKVRLAEIRSLQIGTAEIRAQQIGTIDVSLPQVSPDE